MKGKIFNKNQEGYILAFSLIIVGILLLVAVSLSRVVNREMTFSRLIDYNRAAYFAADTGIECAQYIDNVLRDESLSISLFLNSTSSANGKTDFEQNAVNNVFFSTTTVQGMDSSNYKSKIFCASDGNTNQIFNLNTNANSLGYVNSELSVLNNLNNKKSSYTIQGDATHATTTFGIVVNDGSDQEKCSLVQFAKSRDVASGTTISFSLISKGYSSCSANNSSRVERTIQIYSND